MAWETRGGGGRYYTRSRREGGRVVREYCGKGAGAQLAAALDEFDRAERMAARLAERRDRERLADEQAALAAVLGVIDTAVTAELDAAGYHYHRGEWRRRGAQ